jgi:hypothetical protein
MTRSLASGAGLAWFERGARNPIGTRVPGYASCWWDMPTAQVTTRPAVAAARREYEREKVRERYLMVPRHPHWSPDGHADREPSLISGDVPC